MSAPAFLRAAVAASALMLASIPLALFMHASVTGTAHASDVFTPNYGLDKRCHFDKGRFTEQSACMTSPQPEFAVWGDSFAMHLIPGLARSGIGGSLLQITKSACAPILGVAFTLPGTRYDREWARSCIEFNDSVYEYLKARAYVRVVILSSPFNYFAKNMQHLRRDKVHAPDRAALVAAFTGTIDALRSAGKKVIVVAPMPGAGFDVRSCLQRLDSGAVLLGRDDCDFPEKTYTTRRADALAFLRDVQRVAPVLWPHELLCQGGTCRSRIDGKSVYNDGRGHLSPEGSVAFAEQFRLAEKIRLSAR